MWPILLKPACVALVLLLAGCASTSMRPQPPTVDEVVALSQAGEAPEQILQRMRDGRGLYSLSGSELAELGAQAAADLGADQVGAGQQAEPQPQLHLAAGGLVADERLDVLGPRIAHEPAISQLIEFSYLNLFGRSMREVQSSGIVPPSLGTGCACRAL